MTKRKQSHPSCLVPGLLFILLLVALAGIWVSIQGFTQLIYSEFGSPSQNLGAYQKVYYAILLLNYRDDLRQPFQGSAEPLTFEIDYGESVESLATRLENAGVIRNKEAFKLYLIYKGIDTNIQAGRYLIKPGMIPSELAMLFQDATSAYVTFVILPGWRLEEIAASLPTSGLSFTPEEFLDYVRNPDFAQKPAYVDNLVSLEGFMFPGEYLLSRSASVGEAVTIFINRFDQQITQDMLENYQKNGLSLYEAVILASIIEREAVIKSECPLIASVFYNRLADDMKLESDPTVQYAAGYQVLQDTWWVNPIRLEDLNLDSPYNTYMYSGLPPTPICNPGIESLMAVAYPEDTSYYYFRARCDNSGFHTFSVTYEEHSLKDCP